MRKILIILALFPLFLSGQNISWRNSAGQIYNFNGGVYAHVDSTIIWANSIINDYMSKNSHFDSDYELEVSNFLSQVLNTEYIMPDASDNYYTLYGDSITSGWFEVFKVAGNTTEKIVSKTGNTLKWFMYDTIFNQNNWPARTVPDSGFALLSTTDGFGGILNFRTNATNMAGELPLMHFDNSTTMYFNTQGLGGVVPNFYSSPSIFSMQLNDFTEIRGGLSNSITTALGTCSFNDNSLSTASVDTVFKAIYDYFDVNTPIKNLTLTINQSGANDGSPTGAEFNSHLVDAQTDFTNAGFTFSATINDYSNNKTNPQLTDTIFVVAGDSLVINYDALIYQNITPTYSYTFDYTCDIGFQSVNNYIIPTSISDIGSHSLSVNCEYLTDIVGSASTIIEVINPAGNATIQNILVVGNSLIDNGTLVIVDSLRTNLENVNPTMIGTRGIAPNNHEARAGWGIANFVYDGPFNPFFHNSELDIQTYREDSLGLFTPIDIVIIQLGINDLTTNTQNFPYIDNTVLPSFDSLISAFVQDNTGHIILVLNSKSRNTDWSVQYPTRDQDFYLEKCQYLWQELINTYDGGIYDNSVSVVIAPINLDRTNDYSTSDAIHPQLYGYTHLYRLIRAEIENIYK